MLVAEDTGLFVAEAEDLPDERGVVELAGGPDFRGRLPDLAADRVVVQVLHDREHRWELEREAPGVFMALGAGVRGRAGDGGFRQTGELRLVGDDEFPRVGGVEDVLGILLGDLGKLGLDGGDAFLLPGGQIRSGVAEVRKGLLDEALLDCGKRGDFLTRTHRLDHRPQAVVQGERRVEISNLRQHLAERLALGGRVAHRVEVIEASPAIVELLGGVFEGKESGFIGRRSGILRADRLDVLLRESKRVADVRLDGFGNERGPADLEIGSEERVHG